MKPSIGRIVIYNTTEEDRKLMENTPDCNVQEKLPAIIVAVWSEDCINVKVICDGKLDLWKTSIQKGDNEMNWNWPVIEK